MICIAIGNWPFRFMRRFRRGFVGLRRCRRCFNNRLFRGRGNGRRFWLGYKLSFRRRRNVRNFRCGCFSVIHVLFQNIFFRGSFRSLFNCGRCVFACC